MSPAMSSTRASGLVLAINKWDLVEKDDKTFEEYVARVRAAGPVPALRPGRGHQRADRPTRRPRARRGAHGRRRAPASHPHRTVSTRCSRRPSRATSRLRSRVVGRASTTPPRPAIEPPTFVLFASDAKSVHFSYQRFLENRLRDAFDFEGTPLRLIFRERSRVELEPKKRQARSPRRRKKPTKKSVRKGS